MPLHVHRVTKYDPADRDAAGHYVGSHLPCHDAVARTRELGLFPEPTDVSPYDVSLDEEPGERCPADATFWARLGYLDRGRGLLLEEDGGHATRWHRVTPETVADVRARLIPRARLTVWPPLSEDVESDRAWAFMRTLERGQRVTGTVERIADFGVTFVDLGGCTAMVNLPELSSRHADSPTDVVSVGQEVTARVLDVDMVRERVSLSLRLS